jgi:NAD(P)-dependent dehydrogenase (short-subunit alcohol dehydrogenase family)
MTEIARGMDGRFYRPAIGRGMTRVRAPRHRFPPAVDAFASRLCAMDLKGTVALITGAKRIGAVVAETLAAKGTRVALSYARSEAEARAAAAKVEAAGSEAAVFQADLGTPEACTALVDAVAARFGHLDILINMASVYSQRSFDELTLADWDAVVNIDLRAAFLCARAAVPHLRRQGGGRIINFSDWVAASGRPRYRGFVPYYVAKAGVKALSEALALELAPDNILVNAIAPGPILPPPGTTSEESQSVEDATPLGRWGGEMEIAKAVLALLDSDFITGETLRVDGGRHVR